MELAQEQQFKGLDSERLKPCNRVGIISFCRKALFMQTEKINWNAHVWYMERFQIQPERLDAASPVSSISFTEVTHKKNRELLKKYIRYGLGITNLSVSVIRGEHSAIRNFLNDICQDENEDVCSVTPAQMDDYFKKQRQRSVQAETYNKNVMCIQHFFNFLKVRQYIERIPFDAECCLKKIIPRHLDRSVAQEAADEILEKLCCFPETIRIMYLHLWGVGLRISEVCTLKGNAYYIQGNLQSEAIACVIKELTAVRRLSRYLEERQPDIQSCKDISRKVVEEYLTYLKTEATETKHFHADLNRLRCLLESIGQMCDYPNLIGLFLTRDIPQTPKAAFKTYSDEELKRLNREIVKLDEQTARLMIIHQMLGTRISDTLTLAPDCLSEKNGEIIIRIRQMKTKPYEKPISAELAALIQMAIDYTKEKYGDTPYIFVDDKDTAHAMPYTKVQYRVTAMIYDKDLRDDNGELFGFSTHIYRHYYGVKLTEMHLDDWTIAKLLGHSSVRNVKYYRKMSNQLLADETRKARQKLSAIILNNLDGWEDEYEQIRKDGRL